MDAKNFFSKYLPYAQQVKAQLGQPISITLAQWALESGWGESNLSKTYNNMGGIKYSEYAPKGTTKGTTDLHYANYPSMDLYVKDYVRVMNLSYYKDVRSKYATAGVEDDVKALDESPYAEDPKYFGKIMTIINGNNLQSYDGMVGAGGLYSTTTTPQLNGMKVSEVEKYALLGLGILGLGMVVFSGK